MKNHECPICGTINDHCHSAHCVDNYTDKERNQGSTKMKDDEIRKAFEKWWRRHQLGSSSLDKSDTLYAFQYGYKSRDAEISSIKELTAKVFQKKDKEISELEERLKIAEESKDSFINEINELITTAVLHHNSEAEYQLNRALKVFRKHYQK
jgi:1,2-phenylacetyl-CoA epoxidase catalytic subunit